VHFNSSFGVLSSVTIIFSAIGVFGQSSSTPSAPAPQSTSPVSISIYDRTRSENWQWFAAPPQSETYSYLGSLLRIGVGQTTRKIDWQLELSQPAVLFAPDDAISQIPAQGQLGLGATYYAANENNRNAAAAFFKQGFVRYRFGEDRNLRVGRFEFFDGQETKPKNQNLAWLQTNRIAQRLVGNFGFSSAQRSFDGVDGHFGMGSWDLTAVAARADQGVFNMNGNPELNVDLQYMALTRSQFKQHLVWRAFGLGYHDGRTGITKTDNRPLPARKGDHNNIRVGTYGGDVIASMPALHGQFDLLAWGVLQNGQWGSLNQSSKAGTVEGGYQFLKVPSTPWIRCGYFYGSGDTNATDDRHQTFFQALPTPWIYAHFPFYNLMNNKDGFVQVIDHPSRRFDVRGDVHWLQLASHSDLWYTGGGAYDNKVFGYVGRPSNGHSSLATEFEFTSSWQASKSITMNFYYGYANGKNTVASIYPNDHNAQFGYAELIYRWGEPQRPAR
jgi:Alginate export